MSINNERTNFWSSLPRVLKGLAAVITATSGFITVLYATGYFEDRKKGQNDGPSIPKYTSFSGHWDATTTSIPDDGSKTIFCIEVTQSGNELTGVIKYSEVRHASGAITNVHKPSTGTLKGLVKGSDVEISYVNSEGHSGTAHLNISTDGKNVNGAWTGRDKKENGSSIWIRRDSPCP